MITIIIVSKDFKKDFFLTINSILDQKKIPKEIEVVIVAPKRKEVFFNKRKLLQLNKNIILNFIRDTNEGIYKAMNLGVKSAKYNWVHFLNAGDIFYSNYSLCEIIKKLNNHFTAKILYSDIVYDYKNFKRKVICDKNKFIFNHQCIVYDKRLHEVHGYYIEYRTFHLSDYVFFSFIENKNWEKYDQIIAVCDPFGVSSSLEHFIKRVFLDFVFQRISFFKMLYNITSAIIFKLIKISIGNKVWMYKNGSK